MKSLYTIVGILAFVISIPMIVRFIVKKRAAHKLSQPDRANLSDIQTEIARLEIALGQKADDARQIAEEARDKYRVKKLSELYIEEMNILKKV